MSFSLSRCLQIKVSACSFVAHFRCAALQHFISCCKASISAFASWPQFPGWHIACCWCRIEQRRNFVPAVGTSSSGFMSAGRFIVPRNIYGPRYPCRCGYIVIVLAPLCTIGKIWNIWKAPSKYPYLTFWFAGNGLAPTTNKYSSIVILLRLTRVILWKKNATCNVRNSRYIMETTRMCSFSMLRLKFPTISRVSPITL